MNKILRFLSVLFITMVYFSTIGFTQKDQSFSSEFSNPYSSHKEYKPEISVLASGAAQFDVFKNLIMNVDDIIKFVKNSHGLVIANHMEAINHCPLTRKKLKEILIQNNLEEKVAIPEDGESVYF